MPLENRMLHPKAVNWKLFQVLYVLGNGCSAALVISSERSLCDLGTARVRSAGSDFLVVLLARLCQNQLESPANKAVPAESAAGGLTARMH